MNYSFIEPKEKPIFFQDTRIWISFIMMAIFLLMAFSYFLQMQTSIINENVEIYKINKEATTKQVAAVKRDIEDIHAKVNFTQNINSNNIIIKDSIENLFDLIPKKITLTKINMTQKELIIKGITPTKDVYKFLLAIPLRSIFEQSTVSFYLTDNGYKFTSVNIFEVKQNEKL